MIEPFYFFVSAFILLFLCYLVLYIRSRIANQVRRKIQTKKNERILVFEPLGALTELKYQKRYFMFLWIEKGFTYALTNKLENAIKEMSVQYSDLN